MSADIGQAQVEATKTPQVIIYGHSWLFYWWPVWVLGYVMALLTWLHPVGVQIGNFSVLVSSSTSLGVIYALTILLTILITNTKMRGVASLVVVLVIGFLVLLFAYLDWWPDILAWFGNQTVFMDLGFYLFFSTGLLLLWLLTVFVFDHLSFWRVRPGQLTHEYVLGAVENSYDTDNMVFTKKQNDLFRHWILGLGSGDLEMQTMGGRGIVAKVSNVLFLNWKVFRIQSLIATKPDVPQQA
jgi:hypothetical protein